MFLIAELYPSIALSFSEITLLLNLIYFKKYTENTKHTPSINAAPATAPAFMDYGRQEPEEQMGEPDEQTGLSIRKANDDLIERCLAKHGGKVKPAAAELGISERTIYRKLREKKAK